MKKIFIDASVFLKLLFDEPGATLAQQILEAVETNRVIGYVTPMVLEEIAFKLLYAKASEVLGTSNIWRIREALKLDEEVRSKCMLVLREFYEYVEYMLSRGLRVEHVLYSDCVKALEIVEEYGLLPADAIHVAVAMRLGLDTIASFDEDFRAVRNLKVIP